MWVGGRGRSAHTLGISQNAEHAENCYFIYKKCKNVLKDGCFWAARQAVSKPARQPVSQASQSAGPLPAGFSVSWPTASQAASQLASTQASQRPPSQPAGRSASQQPVSSQSASKPAGTQQSARLSFLHIHKKHSQFLNFLHFGGAWLAWVGGGGRSAHT